MHKTLNTTYTKQVEAFIVSILLHSHINCIMQNGSINHIEG